MTGFISGLRDEFENQMEERMTSVLNNFFKQRIAKAIMHNQISIEVRMYDFLTALERARIPIYLEGQDWWVSGSNYSFQIPFKWKSFLNKNGIVVESDSIDLVEPMSITLKFVNEPILIFTWV
jgi:hypothetical protein